MTLDKKIDEVAIDYLQQELGWQVEGPFYSSVPQPKEEYTLGLKYWFDVLQNHLLSTYIINDHFDQDHTARRQFWIKLQTEVPHIQRWIGAHSKLKGNRLLEVIIGMDNIFNRMQRTFPKVHRKLCTVFQEAVLRRCNEYNEMTFDEKVSYARTVDDMAYQFLEILSP